MAFGIRILEHFILEGCHTEHCAAQLLLYVHVKMSNLAYMEAKGVFTNVKIEKIIVLSNLTRNFWFWLKFMIPNFFVQYIYYTVPDR